MARLSNEALLEQVKHLAACERQVTASLIAHLAEMDKRRLYLAEGCSSLFTYCTQVLRLSEHATYGRIEAARAVGRFPIILERLEEGNKRQAEELVARLRPQPPVPASVRRLPTPSHPSTSPTAPPDAAAGHRPAGNVQGDASPDLPSPAITPPRARPAVVAPLAPQQYKVQFTASAETYAKLRLAQDLLRHQIPDGDPAKIFDRALTALVQALAKQKLAATARPRGSRGVAPGSRHLPAEIKRAVWLRDGGRCAFVSRTGRRCTEQGFLEFHHVTPYAVGGEPTAENIQLRCRAHNGYEAALDFGPYSPALVKEARASHLYTHESQY